MSDDKNLISNQENTINSDDKDSQNHSEDSVGDDSTKDMDTLPADNADEVDAESGIDGTSDEGFTDSEDTKLEKLDYSKLTKEELLDSLRDLINDKPVEDVKNDVDIIKTCFYKILKSEYEKVKKELIDQSGSDGEIEIPRDPAEDYLKELLADYKQKKLDYFNKLEEEKEENLKKKEDIIEKIKILANGEESLNKTFSEFKELQKLWTEIGAVPNSEKNRIWNNYQLQIERFYDFIKINKELRDLDLKKNLENKIELCEKAEDLLLETDILKAYETLQEYHNLWKDIGPVEAEKREEIWERFSETTKKIRKTYQDHFVNLKQEREENYAQKLVLCEKVESLLQENSPKTKNDWIKKSEEIKEIQKLWKTIGMVPKEVNEEVFVRFKDACNKFFQEKKDFFAIINEEEGKNLQKKIDLCVQAESLKDSKDWKKTSLIFFDLQRKWKEVGPVPRKDSNFVWKRFRAACDHFFNAKESFFSEIEVQQKENAIKKEEIINSVINFEPGDSQVSNINKIKQIQKEWIDTGPVSVKDKEELYQRFRSEIEKLYKKLNLSKNQIDIQNYKEKLSQIDQTGDFKKFNEERVKIVQKIKKIEDDIRLWENNMTFFSNDAKDLLSDFTNKLDKAKEELSALESRKKMIDIAIRDFKKKKEGQNEK